MDFNLLTQIVIAGGFSLYIITFSFLFFRKFKRNLEKSKKYKIRNGFFKAIIGGLKSNLISDLDDVVNIYKGEFGLPTDDTSYRSDLSNALRLFLSDLSSDNGIFREDKLDDQIKKEWFNKITEILKDNEKSAPFADLPASESNILKDLTYYIENNKPDDAIRKLSELAGMLQENNTRLKDVSERNRWMWPISVMGFVLTLIFGLANIL